jgi:16S rRNA (guanine527-N7)-methyltransferase
VTSTAHGVALEAAGVPEPARAQLGQYLDLVARWNARVNLTAAHTATDRVAQLVTPVQGAVPWVRGSSLLDVGSGNGSPGVPLALLCPTVRVTLMEPRARRWAFLREVVRELGLGPRVEAWRGRHDTWAGGAADTVTVRAVALDASDLSPLVRAGGVVLRWRAGDEAPPGWRVAGKWDRGVAVERST